MEVPIKTSELPVDSRYCRIPTPRWLWSWLNVTKFIDPIVGAVVCVPRYPGPREISSIAVALGLGRRLLSCAMGGGR